MIEDILNKQNLGQKLDPPEITKVDDISLISFSADSNHERDENFQNIINELKKSDFVTNETEVISPENVKDERNIQEKLDTFSKFRRDDQFSPLKFKDKFKDKMDFKPLLLENPITVPSPNQQFRKETPITFINTNNSHQGLIDQDENRILQLQREITELHQIRENMEDFDSHIGNFELFTEDEIDPQIRQEIQSLKNRNRSNQSLKKEIERKYLNEPNENVKQVTQYQIASIKQRELNRKEFEQRENISGVSSRKERYFLYEDIPPKKHIPKTVEIKKEEPLIEPETIELRNELNVHQDLERLLRKYRIRCEELTTQNRVYERENETMKMKVLECRRETLSFKKENRNLRNMNKKIKKQNEKSLVLIFNQLKGEMDTKNRKIKRFKEENINEIDSMKMKLFRMERNNESMSKEINVLRDELKMKKTIFLENSFNNDYDRITNKNERVRGGEGKNLEFEYKNLRKKFDLFLDKYNVLLLQFGKAKKLNVFYKKLNYDNEKKISQLKRRIESFRDRGYRRSSRSSKRKKKYRE